MEENIRSQSSAPDFLVPKESPQRGSIAAWVGVAGVVLFSFLLQLFATSNGNELPPEVMEADKAVGTAIKLSRLERDFAKDAADYVEKLLSVKGEGRDVALRAAATLQWELGLGKPGETVRALTPRAKDPTERKLNRLWQAIYGDRRFIPGDIQAAPELLDQLAEKNIANLANVHLLERTGRTEEAKALRESLAEPLWKLALGALFVLLLLGLAIVGCVVIYRYIVAKGSAPAAFLAPWGLASADAMAYAFIFYMLITLLLSVPVGVVLLGAAEEPGISWMMLMQSLIALTALAIGLYYLRTLARRTGFRVSDIGLKLPIRREHIRIGAVGTAAALGALVSGVVISLPILKLFGETPTEQNPVFELAVSGGFWNVLLALVLGVVIAPVSEEVFFRGVLFLGLWRRLGSWWLGAIISSLAFALLHPTLFSSLLPLTGVGIVACALLKETGSLIPCIVMHALYNGVLLVTGMLLSGFL